MPHLRLIVLAGMVAALIVVPEASACGCSDTRPWSEVADSDALFLGKLVASRLAYSVEEAPWLPVPNWLPRGREPNALVLVFEVKRWWRGSGRERVEVQTDRSSCALPVPATTADDPDRRHRPVQPSPAEVGVADDGEAGGLGDRPVRSEELLTASTEATEQRRRPGLMPRPPTRSRELRRAPLWPRPSW